MENSLLVIFNKIWLKILYYSTGPLTRFLSNFKNSQKNPILIRISSNFLRNISTCICIRNVIKMENSLLVIFDKIWPKTLYYSTGYFVKFWSNLKIHKNSNFDWNQLKLSTQHKYMYMYQKM